VRESRSICGKGEAPGAELRATSVRLGTTLISRGLRGRRSGDLPDANFTKNDNTSSLSHEGVTPPGYIGRSIGLGAGEAGTAKVVSMSDFARLLESEIPRLRRYARALTRDAARADDLVQSCLVRAIAKEHLWQPGTDLRAWLFTILHNQHVNDVRRAVREGVSVAVEDVAPVLTTTSNAAASLQLRDLERAIATLPEEQRQVILLVGLEGMRYEEVAAILDIPIGTVRSRLSRGREMLRRLMDMRGEPDEPPSGASQKRAPSGLARRAA
jgi:RNA polymerase sigma-70 factor, ECF subfamily